MAVKNNSIMTKNIEISEETKIQLTIQAAKLGMLLKPYIEMICEGLADGSIQLAFGTEKK